ncbi:hypothetical protein RZS08_45880, partial [Arthrospira platensis SPKY1]|nr:hypothetical protein [Arthrospira platensis SPKY1]
MPRSDRAIASSSITTYSPGPRSSKLKRMGVPGASPAIRSGLAKANSIDIAGHDSEPMASCVSITVLLSLKYSSNVPWVVWRVGGGLVS